MYGLMEKPALAGREETYEDPKRTGTSSDSDANAVLRLCEEKMNSES